jgi:hypothetical protein
MRLRDLLNNRLPHTSPVFRLRFPTPAILSKAVVILSEAKDLSLPRPPSHAKPVTLVILSEAKDLSLPRPLSHPKPLTLVILSEAKGSHSPPAMHAHFSDP